MRHVISLGENCDVAFQLRMHGQENVPHFFDWLGTPIDGLIKVIESDFDVFHAEDLEYITKHKVHFISDGPTGIAFYHKFPYVDFHQTRDFHLLYQSFIKICRFQARRFREYVKTLPVTLVRRNISEEKALLLEDVFFRQYPNADAQFLYLVHEGEEFRTPRGRARFISRSRGSLGDPEIWIAILEAEGLLYKRYHHSTAEILGLSHDDHSLSIDDRFTEEQLLRAVAENPSHPLLVLELARHYRKRGNFESAEEHARRSLKLAPERADTMIELILTQWSSGQISADAAADQFVALSERSQFADIATHAADSLLAAKRFAQALHFAKEGIRRNPADTRAYHLCAMSAYELGDVEGARRAIANAIRLNSRSELYHHLHGRFLAELGRRQEAIDAQLACVAAGGRFNPYCSLGWLHSEAGNFDEAVKYWKLALEIAGPQAATVRSWIEGLQAQLWMAELEGTDRP